MGLSFFGEGIFVTYGGCSKNYIMYWGLRLLVYHGASKQCAQTLQILYQFFVILHKILFFYILIHIMQFRYQIMLQILPLKFFLFLSEDLHRIPEHCDILLGFVLLLHNIRR